MKKYFYNLDQRLLRNKPKLWELHLILLVGSVLLLNLIFYLIGYTKGLTIINETSNVENYFFASSNFSLFLVLALTVLVIFGFRYYTHNPLKSLYPLGRLYLLKVYLILAAFVLGLVMCYFTFDQGISDRVRDNYTVKEVTDQLYKYEMGKPYFAYLAAEDNAFFITQKSYPAPFPLNVVSDDEEMDVEYSESPKVAVSVSEAGTRSINQSKPYSVLNGTAYQFGTLEKLPSADSCNQAYDLRNIQDLSDMPNLFEHSFYNYSLRENYQTLKIDEQAWYRDFQSKLDRRDSAAMVNDFLHVINQYVELEERRYYLRQAPKVISNVVYGLDMELELDHDNGDYNHYYDVSIFRNFDDAFTDLGYRMLDWEFFAMMLMISLGFAFILVMTKYIPIVPLLISIVINQILILAFTLLTVLFFYLGVGDSELTMTYLLLAYALMVFGYTIWRLGQGSRQKIVYYGLVSGLVSAIGLPILIFQFVRMITRYPDPCYDGSWLYRFDYNPSNVLIFLFIGSLIGLYFIKKSRTIPE